MPSAPKCFLFFQPRNGRGGRVSWLLQDACGFTHGCQGVWFSAAGAAGIMSHVGKQNAERSRHLSLPVPHEEEPLPRRSKNSSDFIRLGKHVCIFQQGQSRESEPWTSFFFMGERHRTWTNWEGWRCTTEKQWRELCGAWLSEHLRRLVFFSHSIFSTIIHQVPADRPNHSTSVSVSVLTRVLSFVLGRFLSTKNVGKLLNTQTKAEATTSKESSWLSIGGCPLDSRAWTTGKDTLDQ